MNELDKLMKAKQRVIKKYEMLPDSAKIQRLRLLKKYQSLNKRISFLTGKEVEI